jgi:hypothetical protein
MTAKATVKPQDTEPIFDETGNELATQSATLPAVNPLLTLHQKRVFVDDIKLVQGTSAAGTPGTFRNPETDEAFGELRVIPVKITANRTLWPKEFVRDRNPDCSSLDGLHAVESYPNGGVPDYPGQECALCKHNVLPWESDGEIEPCKAGYDVLFFCLDTDSVIRMRFQSTGQKLVEKTLARANIFQKQVVRLLPTRQTNPKGSWWQVQGVAMGELSTEQRDYIEALAEGLTPAESH